MAEAQGPSKTCVICGVDVSAKPRAKDAQGRYVCQECMTKARQAKAAQTSPPPAAPSSKPAGAKGSEPDNSFLLGMGSKNAVAETGTKPCPECGRALSADASICVGCGFSFEKGKRLQVKVTKAKPDPSAKGKGKGGGGTNPHLIGVGALIVCGIAAAVSMVVPDLAQIYTIVSLIFSVVMGLWVLLLAFQESALEGLLCWFCGPYQIYWIFLKCENTLVKWLWSVAMLNGIIGLILSPAALASMTGGAGGP